MAWSDARIAGRFNLYGLDDDPDLRSASVGYRVAEWAAGRGLATSGLRALCRLAVAEHHRHRLTAAVADANVASQRVLAKAGFSEVGVADAARLGGRPGTLWSLELIA